MNNTQAKIIQEYEKTKVVHPSLREIATKVGCSKTYVAVTVKEYIRQNKSFGLK